MLNSMRKGKFKECQIYYKQNGKFQIRGEDTLAGIEFLHHYGAFVVLAHPTLLKREAFNGLINLNFDGIEAKYYRNKENENLNTLLILQKKELYIDRLLISIL